jgi:hypothetical protein
MSALRNLAERWLLQVQGVAVPDRHLGDHVLCQKIIA